MGAPFFVLSSFTKEIVDMPLMLFDLDGTLVDSAPDLVASMNRLRHSMALEELPYETLREYAGAGARGLLWASFGLKPEDETFEKLKAEFLANYQAHCCDHVTIFDGITSLLDTLEARGWQWGIVTNKFASFTEPLVKKAGFAQRAAAVISGDATAHLKPHPDNLFVALEKIGATAETCIYVGDDIRDAKAARAAGMDFIAVDWGYIRHDTPIQTWGANYIAHQPDDIIQLLPQLEGRLMR